MIKSMISKIKKGVFWMWVGFEMIGWIVKVWVARESKMIGPSMVKPPNTLIIKHFSPP